MRYYRHIRSILSSNLWWDSVEMLWYSVVNRSLCLLLTNCDKMVTATVTVWWSSGRGLCLIAYLYRYLRFYCICFVWDTYFIYWYNNFNQCYIVLKKYYCLWLIYPCSDIIFSTIDKLLLLSKRCNVNGAQSRGIKYEGDSAP